MSDQNSDAVQFSLNEGVALIQLDDGKANALSHVVLRDLNAALDRAEKESAGAIVLAGREGRFSADRDIPRTCQNPTWITSRCSTTIRRYTAVLRG